MKVKLSKAARRDMGRLDKAIAKRVAARLVWLGENGENIPHLPLKGRLAGWYKFRIGDYYSVTYEMRD